MCVEMCGESAFPFSLPLAHPTKPTLSKEDVLRLIASSAFPPPLSDCPIPIFQGRYGIPSFAYIFFTVERLAARALLYDRRANLLRVARSDQPIQC